MSTSAMFDKLTVSVNQAEAEIKDAGARSRAQLQAQVEQARAGAEQRASQIQAQATQAHDQAAAGWQSMKAQWQAHVSDLHDKAADKKAEMDRDRAQKRAEKADLDAGDAVSFAIAAVQEAEYAVLDAALAHADADAATS
jgi:hypothetical protein